VPRMKWQVLPAMGGGASIGDRHVRFEDSSCFSEPFAMTLLYVFLRPFHCLLGVGISGR
jgi:hypothetical protein